MNYADIISVTENSVLFSYELEGPGFAVLEINGRKYSSEEATGTGRFAVDGLEPDHTYRAELSGVTLEFKTLPAPEGEELGRFALISDPHVSTKNENRKGRFFVESAALARETFEAAESLGAEFAVIPGDITNAGTEEEYIISKKIFDSTSLSLFPLPGNHDHPENGYWEKFIGPRRWQFEKYGYTWVAVDTSKAILLPEDAALLTELLEQDKKLIICTHYHLFETPRIDHKPCLGIRNSAEYKELLEQLSKRRCMIYAGHQNICCCAGIGTAVQLNLPQPPQFPCAWILVRVFANGFYHQMIPISSEIMRQWSRRSSDAAALFYNERQWQGAYRFQSSDQSNFLWEGK